MINSISAKMAASGAPGVDVEMKTDTDKSNAKVTDQEMIDLIKTDNKNRSKSSKAPVSAARTGR